MPRTLLLEIGCEELPTSFVRSGMEQMARLAEEELKLSRVAFGKVRALGTPRRLALMVHDVAEEVSAQTEELLGPAESAARGADGKWTRAAEGFAKKNNVAVESLSIIDTPKGRYVRAERRLEGGPTVERLPGVLQRVVSRIAFAKSMRWADIETPFGRPVQWLVALYGADVISFEFVRLTAGRTTRGHRFLAPAPLELAKADDYVDALRRVHVLADPEERRLAQHGALERAASAEGGTLVRNAFLEGEVLGLVEEPFAVVGHFDKGYLALPEELIETVMSHHQRYFAVRDAGGKLMPAFITVVNTALDPSNVKKGNERAMRPRLADAQFFVTQDRAVSLESRVAKLDGVVYHRDLGSYGDKIRRLEKLAPWVAEHFGADEAHAARAAKLAKADLVSLTVGEFPELQGIMGRDYARNDKEPGAVAEAIAEHYLPKGADDAVAESKVGAALAVTDRLDTLVGLFAIGQRPSGGGDPFGLRRAAIGLLRTLLHHRVRLSIAVAAGRAYELFHTRLPRSVDETGKELTEFVRERLEGILNQRFPVDVVRACIATGHDDPVDLLERVEAVAGFRASTEFARVAKAFERVFNISREAPLGEPDVSLLAKPEEKALLTAFSELRPRFRAYIDGREFVSALRAASEALPEVVDKFFEAVLVNDKNAPAQSEARLRLLARIAEEVGVIARFDTLSAEMRAAAPA